MRVNRIVILLIFSTILSCGQWKVSSLKSKQFSFIKNGAKPGNVKINIDEYALENLSFNVGIFYDNVCISDNLLKRVQILNPDGDVKLIIGSVHDIDAEKIKAVNFNFNTIGSFVMDMDDNIYIQNRFPQSQNSIKKNAGGKDSEEINFSPSYILVFNSKGELQYTLGQRGTPDIPFYYIERLNVDERGRLFVISRSFNTWSVFRFDNRKRDFYIDLGKIEFQEQEGKDIFKGRIENVKMYRSGEKLLISVAYYHGLRLKYRKVYEYSITRKKISRVIVNIPDPRNVLFNIVDDKLIYFWDIDEKEIKFMICSMEGNIINNIYLNINNKKTYYSKIISDESGEIYSYHVTKDGIKILEWE